MLGAVLMGGRSRRMGRDKALIELRGRPLWTYSAAAMLEAGVTEVLALAQPGQELGTMPTGVTRLNDSAPDGKEGPLVALNGALQLAQARGVSHLFVTPCDVPLVSARDISWVCEALSSSGADAAVLDCAPAGPHPLFGVYRVAEAARPAAEAVKAGHRAAKEILSRLEVCVVRLPEQRHAAVVAPCNTPTELDHVAAKISAREGC